MNIDTDKKRKAMARLKELVREGDHAEIPGLLRVLCCDADMRDDFAKSAMQGLLAAGITSNADMVAAQAYRQADAMLTKRMLS